LLVVLTLTTLLTDTDEEPLLVVLTVAEVLAETLIVDTALELTVPIREVVERRILLLLLEFTGA